MTESDWASCREPQLLLDLVRDSGRASDRKLRLFACGCCRRIWRLILDGRARRAVEVAEQFADGLAGAHELLGEFQAASAVMKGASPPAADPEDVDWMY